MKSTDLASFYEKQLEQQILPFWLRYAPDNECGGYVTCLDRDGSVIDPDKLCLWSQGRMAWAFAWLYNEWRPEPEWLEFAERGVDFLLAHGFSSSGRMYYATQRDGTPLLAGQDYHVEFSSILAFNEVARARGDSELRRKAREMFDHAWPIIQDPVGDWNPWQQPFNPCRQHGYSLIPLNVLQHLRAGGEEPEDNPRIDTCIDAMLHLHLKPERRLLLEWIGADASQLPGSRGRWVNPGHMIEGGIFIIHEAIHRRDAELKQHGLDLIRWGFDCGWDREFGGIFNDIDGDGKPIMGHTALLADSKLWWQHAEALYGLALAHRESGDPWYWEQYRRVHDYSFSHFADPEFGEWYGMLDRTGRPINRAKGMERKNAFHIVRNFFWCSRLKPGDNRGRG